MTVMVRRDDFPCVAVITCTATGRRWAVGTDAWGLWWSTTKSKAKAGRPSKKYASLYEAIRAYGPEAFEIDLQAMNPHRMATEARRISTELARAARAAGLAPERRGRPRKPRPPDRRNTVQKIVDVQRKRSRLEERIDSTRWSIEYSREKGWLDFVEKSEHRLELLYKRLAAL